MKYLILLLAPLAFGQGTDLPGSIGALPDGAGAPTKVCSYDAALAHCAGVISDTSTTSNWLITAKDTGFAFNNFVNPAADLTQSLGACASSVTCPGGLGAKEWLSAHIQNIYNYGANAMSLYSDTQLMLFDTHAAQPIQFYTTNTLRGQFKAGGAFSVVNLTGSGTRCADATSAGDLGIGSTVDCFDPTVPNTISATQTFTATQLFHSINPVANLTYSLGDCAMSATCPSGAGAKEWAALHVQNIYNYGGGALGLYSDSQSIILDTGSAAAGVLLYTNGVQRIGTDGSGNVYIGNTVGTGNRHVCASATGFITAPAIDCVSGGSGTVTSIGTTSPISGGTITTTGTISCPTCAVTNADNGFSTTQTMHTITPATNNTYQIGDTTHNLTALFTTNIYNYVSGTALGFTGTSSAGGVGIAVATTTSADIAFYPNSAQSFTLKASGAVRLNNGAGGGNRCLQVDNNGDITFHTAGTC